MSFSHKLQIVGSQTPLCEHKGDCRLQNPKSGGPWLAWLLAWFLAWLLASFLLRTGVKKRERGIVAGPPGKPENGSCPFFRFFRFFFPRFFSFFCFLCFFSFFMFFFSVFFYFFIFFIVFSLGKNKQRGKNFKKNINKKRKNGKDGKT